jgi:hypothetical protein
MPFAREGSAGRPVARAIVLPLALACSCLWGVYALQGCSTGSGRGSQDASTRADAASDSDATGLPDTNDATTAPDSTLPQDSAAATDAPTPPDSAAPADVASSDITVPADATNLPDASDAAASDVAIDAPVGCGPDGGLAPDLSCTGLYSDWATKTISPGVLAYTPGFVLWSDGAVKSRWISLPPGSQIDTTDMDDWVFPVDTKIWKQFVVGGQLVETRLIWKQGSGWQFSDYLWSADGSSAPLLKTGETNVNGTTYEIPALDRCPSCHSGRQDDVLGFDLIGLGVPAAQGVTLASLVAAGQLTQPPPAVSMVIPEDATQLAAPALGWLHVNCGASCHNTNANAMATSSHLYLKLLAGQLYPPDGGMGARVEPRHVHHDGRGLLQSDAQRTTLSADRLGGCRGEPLAAHGSRARSGCRLQADATVREPHRGHGGRRAGSGLDKRALSRRSELRARRQRVGTEPASYGTVACAMSHCVEDRRRGRSATSLHR